MNTQETTPELSRNYEDGLTVEAFAQEKFSPAIFALSVATGKRCQSTNKSYPDMHTISSLEDLQQAACFDHIAGVFTNNERADKNFISTRCIVMDCDNDNTDNAQEWLTPEKLHARLENVEFYVIFSRNHNKIKHKDEKGEKSARPRFHIYFALHEEITQDKKNSINELKEAILKICPELDKSAKDVSRQFFGVEKPEVKYFAGELDISEYVAVNCMDAKIFSQEFANMAERVENNTVEEEEPTIQDNYDVIKVGERNDTLHKKAIHLLATRRTKPHAWADFLDACKKCEETLPIEEIQTIFQSALNSNVYQLRLIATDCINSTADLQKAYELFQGKIANNPRKNSVNPDKIFKTAQKLSGKKDKKQINNDFNFLFGKQELTLPAVENLIDELGITARFNVISGKIEVSDIPNDEFIHESYKKLSEEKRKTLDNFTILALYLLPQLQQKYKANLSTVKDFLSPIIKTREYNPVTEMLTNGTWDGQDRLNELYKIMNLDKDLYKIYVRKWLHQAIAMAFNDNGQRGCDFVLCLQGKQGTGKTTLARCLAVNHEWFKEGLTINVENRDTVISACSAWIDEIGEANYTFRLNKTQDAFKAFITANVTPIRRPYGATYEEITRRNCFIATINTSEFIYDYEGGTRRYAVIPNVNFDHKKLRTLPKEWFIQLYRQVYTQYFEKDNEGYRLTQNERDLMEIENMRYTVRRGREIELLDLLDFSAPKSAWHWQRIKYIIDNSNKQLEHVKSADIGKSLTGLKNMFPQLETKRGKEGVLWFIPPIRRNSEIIIDDEPENTNITNPEQQITLDDTPEYIKQKCDMYYYTFMKDLYGKKYKNGKIIYSFIEYLQECIKDAISADREELIQILKYAKTKYV